MIAMGRRFQRVTEQGRKPVATELDGVAVDALAENRVPVAVLTGG